MSDCRDLVVWEPPVLKAQLIEPGRSIQDAYNTLPAEYRVPGLVAFRDGQLIEQVEWSRHYLYEGQHVTFAVMPQGGGGKGKGIISTIAGIALIVASYFLPMASPILFNLGVGLLISGVGTMLIKPPSLNSNMGNTNRDSSYYGLTGQSNEAKPYQPIPKLYGSHKLYPAIASNPIIRNAGEVSRISTLYDLGVGMYNISNIRIGETPAETFAPTFAFHYNEQTPQMQFVGNKVTADQMSFVLQQNQPLILRSDPEAAYIEVDLAFARGLAYYNDNGNPTNTKVAFRYQYRRVGDSAWIGVGPSAVQGVTATYLNGEGTASGPVDFIDPDGYVTIQGHTGNVIFHWRGKTYTTPNPPDGTNGYTGITLSQSGSYQSSLGGYRLRVRATAHATNVTGFVLQAASTKPIVAAVLIGALPSETYEVRIERLDPISTSTRRMDEATVTQIKTFKYGVVVNLRVPHTMLEMTLIGSEKISGVVQNLSLQATSVLNQYDVWGNVVGFAATRNHAWICLDALLGPCNPRPLSPSQIDFPSWVALAAYCDQPRTWTVGGQPLTDLRFTCDVVVDYQTTIKEFIDSVLASCHATLTMTVNGKWGVIIDERNAFTPRQLITPANSWNFSGRRIFPEDTHALIVSFLDYSREYQKQEIIVYRDGYDESNATKFENAGTMGIVTFWHAWAYGRFMFAQAIARQEIFTLTMDVENLAAGRGDGVLLAHDVPIIGGAQARIVSVNASTSTVVISQELAATPNGYSVRLRDGTIRTGLVVGGSGGDTWQLETVAGLNPDDLIVMGETDRITAPYIILSVDSGDDFTAKLQLVRYDPDMYDSDLSPLPVWNPTWGTDVLNETNLAVNTVSVSSSVAYVNRRPVQTWVVVYGVNSPSVFGYSELTLIVPGFPDEVLGRSTGYSFEYAADLISSKVGIARGATIRIDPYTASGVLGKSGYATLTTTPDTAPPSPVRNFAVNVQSETISMFWNLQDDPDTISHEIRYHPDAVNGTWEQSQQIGTYDWWVTTANCGARTGKYFIRTRDTTGNVSSIVWQRTSIETLPDIDLILSVLETGWPGTLENMVLENGKPALAGDFGSVVPEGFYTYAQTVDLGQIYEVRISSKVKAHAESSYSMMAAWIPIANQRPLAPFYNEWWKAVLEVRASNTSTVMADWTPLSSPTADPIGGSRDDAWTPWRPIQVGDVTGRFLQFRLHVYSYDPDIRAVLDDAHVDIDVKERRWFSEDQPVPAAGTSFYFDPAFQDVPTVAITLNGGTATRYEISSKDRLGFFIKLFNGSTAVAGNIDIAAIGWGKEKTQVV